MHQRFVLCPVDFSEQSRRALLWASAIAQHRGAELTVLSVVEPLLAQAAGIQLGIDLTRTEAEPAMRRFVHATLRERFALLPDVRLEATVGEAAEVILQTSRRLQPDLIVMGTHGLSGVRKLILGSTTEQVLRRTEWPVLAVPAGSVTAPSAEHPCIQLKRILVATDFGGSATAALEWASDLASDTAIPVVIAHVVEPVLVSPLWQPLVADLDSQQVAAAHRALERSSDGFHNTHVDFAVSVGSPGDTIASLAIQHGAGLIVMGLTNSEDTLPHTPGSIAYRVLRKSHVAVVVVPRLSARTAPDSGTRSRPQPSELFAATQDS